MTQDQNSNPSQTKQANQSQRDPAQAQEVAEQAQTQTRAKLEDVSNSRRDEAEDDAPLSEKGGADFGNSG